MRELADLFDRLQGKAVKVTLIYEHDGKHFQARFNRLSKKLVVGENLNWDYWRGIIHTRDTRSRSVDVVGGKLTVYVEGSNDTWLCAS